MHHYGHKSKQSLIQIAAAGHICKILQTGAAASNYMDQSCKYLAECSPCIFAGLRASDCRLPTRPQSGMHEVGTD